MSGLGWSCVCVDGDSARSVRRAACAYLERYADLSLSDLSDAEQIIGELVANVILHGAPPFGVSIDWRKGRAQFCISDRGGAQRLLYPIAGPLAERGRGLLIVRALGGELVVDPPAGDRGGLRIVVQLPVRKRTSAAA